MPAEAMVALSRCGMCLLPPRHMSNTPFYRWSARTSIKCWCQPLPPHSLPSFLLNVAAFWRARKALTGRVCHPTGPSKPLPSLLRVRLWAPMSPSTPWAPSSSVFVLPLSWPPNVTLSAFCARPSMGTHASLGTRPHASMSRFSSRSCLLG